jgi:16S rRNA (cytidine1402-2'-O)-methyltransferase
MSGRLSIVSTPIGNLGDITLRALEHLREADAIYAEDTRVTRKLLARYELDTPLERCDENTMEAVTPLILHRLQEGARIAYVSDAGTPGVSDPGLRLVAAVRTAQRDGLDIELAVVPGASAVLTALVGSGFTATAFYFGGFLPRKAGERARLFESLSALDAVLVFYESNRRTAATLTAIAAAFPAREVCMARELTKLFEEFACASAPQLAADIATRTGELKGEVVIVIGPPEAAHRRNRAAEDLTSDERVQVEERARQLRTDGLSRSQAAKQLAREAGITRAQAYELLG